MKTVNRYKHTLRIFSLTVCCIIIFSKCINDENTNKEQATEVKTETPEKTVSYSQFAGSQVCANCHKSISNNYMHTAHFITSRSAAQASVKGSFTPGENSFMYSPDRIVKLEKRDSGLYQVYYYRGSEKVIRRFDITVGSGTKGQTYLSWVNDQLIELPVSYFTQVKQWANSPGYPLYPTLFNREATSRCMECHSTYAGTLTPPFQEPEKFDSTKIILGIGCEKCHGPAAKHVAYQTQHPDDTTAHYIVNPAKLSAKLNIDLCAICHAGRLQKTKPSFEFLAGDTLANYFHINPSTETAANIDVHGNQYGLLAASKCFKMSTVMTCTTCHDVHKNESGNTEIFSQRCMSCHTTQHKTIEGITNNNLVKNCINCHMPVQPSMSITFLLQGETTPAHALMRTHLITVYNDETKKYIENLKASHKKNS